MHRLRNRHSSLLVLLILIFCHTPLSYGFNEDICQFKMEASLLNSPLKNRLIDGALDQSPYFNCYEVSPNDGDGGIISGGVTFIKAMTEQFHARSIIHFDATYLIAVLNDMSQKDALTVASNSQAVDQGEYIPVDSNGKQLIEARTGDLSGLGRDSFKTGGFAFHYVPWFSKGERFDARYLKGNKSQLEYRYRGQGHSPFNKREHSLNHLRNWAFYPNSPLCTLGLTDNQGQCFPVSPEVEETEVMPDSDKPCTLTLPNIEPQNTVVYIDAVVVFPVQSHGQIPVGTQVISNKRDNPRINSGDESSLGVYLHSLTDRISHNVCTNDASIEHSDINDVKPTLEALSLNKEEECTHLTTVEDVYGRQLRYDYYLHYPPACGQVTHGIRHLAEVGHSPIPERTSLALELTNKEIQAWIKEIDYVEEANNLQSRDWKELMPQIEKALESKTANCRVEKLCEIAVGNGRPWFDNSTSCDFNCGDNPPELLSQN